MTPYHKIQTVFKRDPETGFKRVIFGEWACPEFEVLKDIRWEFTEKVDGTCIRVMWDQDTVRFAGRNDKSDIPVFLRDKLEEMFPVGNFLEAEGPDGSPWPMVCLYGEGYGDRIQKAGKEYISDGVSFILFDVLVGGHWLERINVEAIASALGIKVAPVLGYGSLMDAVDMVRGKRRFESELKPYIDGVPGVPEGLIMRPVGGFLTRTGKRIIGKIKVSDFDE